MVWKKATKKGQAGLTDGEWEALPDTMELRYVKTKAKGLDGKMKTIYLVTTLLDPADYPGEEIALVYNDRWTIEVKIRDIKTTMKFEMMRVKTPEMANRTMKMIQIAYNLVKARQAEAIKGEAIQLGELSFKGTLDLIDKNRTSFTGLVSHPRRLNGTMEIFEADLRDLIIQLRPGRQEPRATKTRPKSYQYLTRPRGEFTEIFIDKNLIDKNLLFHPFRNRPTGSPGIEGVRGEKGVGKVQSRESCPVSAPWSINSDRNY